MAPLGSKRLGHYELLGTVGSGGMGTVYRARDARLDRVVAVKVLSRNSSTAEDDEMRARLAREARTIARFTHPHICTVYDFAQHEETDYLVMEMLQGETLAERLRRGPLRIGEVVKYAIEMADALREAHRQGVIHRDLKPSNVMLTKNGVKLLDFGLARTIRRRGSEETITQTLTKQGSIAGTYYYMSPEQLQGEELDARTDIFSFGAVLYEMVTGKKAFGGETAASVIAAVMEREPTPLREAQPEVPATIEWLIRTCLRKDPDDRWQTMHDLKLELERSLEREVPPKVTKLWSPKLLLSGVLVAALVVGGVFGGVIGAVLRSRAPRSPDTVRFQVAPPPGGSFNTMTSASVPVVGLAVSPDGKTLALVAIQNGPAMIWVRRFAEAEFRPLPGTEGAQYPFWSPDGRWIGFFAQNKLKKIEATGGPAVTLSDVTIDPRGGAWLSSDTIVFAPSHRHGLLKIPASGGAAQPIFGGGTESERRWWPSPLPDGTHFLYYDRVKGGVYVGSLDGKAGPLAARTDWSAFYADGYLFYVHGGSVMAQRFDWKNGVARGDAVPLTDGAGGATNAASGCSASQTGILACSGIMAETTRLEWYDRRGMLLERLNEPGMYSDFGISPDGRKIVWSTVDSGRFTHDLWLHDVDRGTTTRFTNDPLLEASPVWSLDSRTILYRSNRTGLIRLYLREFGSKSDRLVLDDDQLAKSHPNANNTIPNDLSANGRFLVYSVARRSGWDVFAWPMDGSHDPFALAETPFNEMDGSLSADGKWLVFTSDESGRFEVYVQSFPAGNNRQLVSAGGGSNPRWRGDGRELYYLSAERKLMAVSFLLSGQVGKPVELFSTRALRGIGPYTEAFQPSRDGQRFLINSIEEERGSPAVTVVMNWPELLTR